MNLALHISVDLESGEVRLGAHRVGLVASPAPGAFYLDSTRGPVLRALRFEERTLVLLKAAPSEVAARIAQAALLVPGDAPELLRVAVSLALAGGAEDAPSFAECASFAARQEGWDWQRVHEAPALVVDRLNRTDAQSPREDGWKRIVFPEPTPELAALVAGMTQNLQQRSQPRDLADSSPEPDRAPAAADLRPRFSFRFGQDTQAPSPDSLLAEATPVTPLQMSGAGAPQARPALESVSDRTGAAIVASEPPGRPAANFAESQSGRHALSVRTVLPKTAMPAATRAPRASATLRPRVSPARLDSARRAAPEAMPPLAGPASGPRQIRLPVTAAPSAPGDGPQAAQAASLARPGSAPGPIRLPVAAAPSARGEDPHAAPTPEPERTVARAVDLPSFSDWIDDLAGSLADECDLRGIDP
jgi:hypothetical protein